MTIFVIGIGVMGSAIAKSLAQKGRRVLVFDINYLKAKALQTKNIIAQKNFKNLKNADYVILSVKPYHIRDVADRIKDKIKPPQIIISIAAGVRIGRIKKLFNHQKVVRMMPNLGLSVGLGIAGWKAAGLNNAEKQRVKKFIGAFTEEFEVKNEGKLDAVTAISGSGPAYFFAFAKGLELAAKKLGFNVKDSRKLAETTFSAAAVLQKNQGYDKLISQVASRKGTTEQAVRSFNSSRLEKIVFQAVKAAHKRAKEISKQ